MSVESDSDDDNELLADNWSPVENPPLSSKEALEDLKEKYKNP